MKKPIAFALLALTLASVPAHADPWIGARIWNKFESLFHHKTPAPQPAPEKIGPLSEKALANTPSAAFVRALVANNRYTIMLKHDQRIIKLLNTDPALALQLQSPEYQSHVKNGPSLGFLFGAPSGVSEGYSVGEHTVRVLEMYRQQKKYYDLQSLRLNPNIRNIDTLLTWTLAFHDIGKSFAAQAGDKSHETIYSVPIAADLLKTAGFNADETRLASALIWSHQILGNYVRKQVAPDTVNDQDPDVAAIHGIHVALEHANIDKHEFFKLMMLVMTSDAASYDALHTGAFLLEDNGQLISRRKAMLDQLESEI